MSNNKRTVTVFSTKGQRVTKVETEATTWGELKKDFQEKGIQYEGMQAVVNETKGILKLDGAILPIGITAGDKITNDITIFLTPSKVQAGCIDIDTADYKELKQFIKEKRSESEDAKTHFGDYTHSSTEELRDMVSTWIDDNEQVEEEEYEYDFNNDNNEQNDEPETCSESCNQSDNLSKVVNLLQEALNILSGVPGVSGTSEFEKLKQQAEEIEFELQNSN